MVLLNSAVEKVDIASYYWTLRGHGNVTDSTDKQVCLTLVPCVQYGSEHVRPLGEEGMQLSYWLGRS